ncbi:hypothetical protein [Duncaniella dubosii]|uniref:hypothetical protein n=1 Tax=Duncaniella dubosii TaxID=2518971 RepID=UPI003F67EC92
MISVSHTGSTVRLPENDSRVIIVSNHPLGGLDGMILAGMVSGTVWWPKDVKFGCKRSLLTFVEPLRSRLFWVS